MKKNDFVQIKGLDSKELAQKIQSLKGELSVLIMDKNMKKLKDLRTVSKKRKDLAQVSTILRQKQLLEQLESSKEVKTDDKQAKAEKGKNL